MNEPNVQKQTLSFGKKNSDFVSPNKVKFTPKFKDRVVKDKDSYIHNLMRKYKRGTNNVTQKFMSTSKVSPYSYLERLYIV